MKELVAIPQPELPNLLEAALIRPFTESRRDIRVIKKLDEDILYARSPAPGKEQSYGIMTPAERAWWVEGDENHHLVAICASGDKDPTKPVGFVYRYKKDVDSKAREPHIRAMAKLPEGAALWELNFDAPGRRDYMKLVESGVRQDLVRFFSEGDEPKAVVYYAEVDDMADDGAILQGLGGKIIGKINYDHPEKTRSKKDTAILITREDFKRALEGKAKTLDRSEAGTPAALATLERRARAGRAVTYNENIVGDVLIASKEYHGQAVFDQLEAISAGASLRQLHEGWQYAVFTYQWPDLADSHSIHTNTFIRVGGETLRIQYMRDGGVELRHLQQKIGEPTVHGSYYRDPINHYTHFLFEEKISTESVNAL